MARFFKKTETILIKDLKEIRCRQNIYSFISENGEIIKIPHGNLTYNDVQSFKDEINRLVTYNHILCYDK